MSLLKLAAYGLVIGLGILGIVMAVYFWDVCKDEPPEGGDYA